MSFLVGSAHAAEVVLEQVVALQSQKLLGRLPTATANNLGDGNLAVVIADTTRDASEVLECSPVPLLKGLRAFLREHLAEDRIRVRQRHDEESHLHKLSLEHDGHFAEIGLCFTRSVAQRYEDLGLTLLPSANRILDDRVAAVVSVLGLQSVKDALCDAAS